MTWLKMVQLTRVVLLEKWRVNQSCDSLDGAKQLHIDLTAHLDDLSLINSMSACSSSLDSKEVSTGYSKRNPLNITKYIHILDCKTEAGEVQRENITYNCLVT